MHRLPLIATLLVALAHANTLAAQSIYQLRTNIPYTELEDAYAQERCKLDLYYPDKTDGFPTLIWFHGGGLKNGNKHIPERLKSQGIAIVAVNYRMYPKVGTPVPIEDAASATAWVFENIASYGGDPDKIFISGHSAGGYLASMIGFDKSYLAAHDIDADRIAGLIPYSGHTITHMTVREAGGIPDTQPIIDKYAPLFHTRAGAPPIALLTGNRELELLGRYEENAYFWRMLQVVEHPDATLYEFDGYGHDMLEPAHPVALDFIKRILAKKAARPIDLFNGQNLDGWHIDVPAMDDDPSVKSPFIVRDGYLVSLASPGGHIITDKEYSNYRLEIQYRFSSEPGNCGALVHVSTPRALYGMFPKSIESQLMHENAGDFWCIELDITTPDMEARRGPQEDWGVNGDKLRRIPNLTDDSENPVGQWNTKIIECVGDEIKVWLNGDLVNYGYDCQATSGRIALQAEGSEVEFRKVQLTPITQLTP
ncbi:conserved domain protein [Verrucomicrobiia bacterium DG1235]|nr:conserved domain protein [Verrucomicrobiae bacterium DG1235]